MWKWIVQTAVAMSLEDSQWSRDDGDHDAHLPMVDGSWFTSLNICCRCRRSLYVQNICTEYDQYVYARLYLYIYIYNMYICTLYIHIYIYIMYYLLKIIHIMYQHLHISCSQWSLSSQAHLPLLEEPLDPLRWVVTVKSSRVLSNNYHHLQDMFWYYRGFKRIWICAYVETEVMKYHEVQTC